MKHTIESLLQQAFTTLKQKGQIPSDLTVNIKAEESKEASHGDYSTNLAFLLAKPCRVSPKELAASLLEVIPKHADIEKVAIAGAGFINFFVHQAVRLRCIPDILKQGTQYGVGNQGQGQKVLLECVSANPTGPLHVGHGRSAAFGGSLANLLRAAGYQVEMEYYVNDAGRQMQILAVSVWLRYLECCGEALPFPSNAYKGDYVPSIAASLYELHGNKLSHPWKDISADLPLDEPEGGDKELYIDAVIASAQNILGKANFALFHQKALTTVLDDIKDDLRDFGITYDQWFSEASLEKDGSIENGIAALKKGGFTYEQDGALWFKSMNFGDEKDRVLIRANGQTTYFASDVAYHWNKYHRGYDRVIDIFGADHHGYIDRIRAAVTALGHNEDALTVLLVQFAVLYRGAQRVQMSTRSGSFVTLRELREEVGKDAARFFYVARKPEQHMDFDLDLAKSESSDNPVYYIQYAHARICSVLRQLQERKLTFDESLGLQHLHLLTTEQESALITQISRYPSLIEAAAAVCEPHQVAYYLRELANGLHSYYNAVTLLCEEQNLRNARLSLLKAVQQVLFNGLTLLGLTAPESM